MFNFYHKSYKQQRQDWKFNVQNYSEVIEVVIYKYKEKSLLNEGTILWWNKSIILKQLI